jgi:hypothetical protein
VAVRASSSSSKARSTARIEMRADESAMALKE